MSDVFYPLSLIQQLVVSRVDRTVKDAFEDGSSAARRLWTAQYFKRRLALTHAPLTEAEFRTLRAFNTQRHGGYDSFWFRDNVHRTGNAKVRFASELPLQYQGRARMLNLQLEEVAAIRALPEIEEVATAAGASPAFWFDANRELYYTHNGTTVSGEAFARDEVQAYPAAWQGGTTLPLGNTTSQWQHYAFTASQWAKSGSNVSGPSGTQPVFSLFAIVRAGSAPVSNQVLFGIGTVGSTHALGLQYDSSGYFTPWIGGSAESWTTARVQNSATNTWRSIAVSWPASSNTASLTPNGGSAVTESKARSYTAGPVTIGAASDGTLKCTADVAHIMGFNRELSSGEVDALHNLFAHQFGLTLV